MSNDFHPFFDESELSEEDLAVLKAFDEMEWNEVPRSTLVEQPQPYQGQQYQEALSTYKDEADFLQEMQLLFLDEAAEGLETMRRALQALEYEELLREERFVPLRRGAHKIRGSASSVNYPALATIAGCVEEVAEQVVEGQLAPGLGLCALGQGLIALEDTLQSIIEHGTEDDGHLVALVTFLEFLFLDQPTFAPPAKDVKQEPEKAFFPLTSLPASDVGSNLFHVEPSRVGQLLAHSQQLTSLRTAMESLQAQVAQALQEMHIAQARLRDLQPRLTTLLINVPRPLLMDVHSSSLIKRILGESETRDEYGNSANSGHGQKGYDRRWHSTNGTAMWDELDMEHYGEQDLLMRSLNEAIADIALTAARVQSLSEQQDRLLQQYMAQATQVYNDTLQLRLISLRLLFADLKALLKHFSAQKSAPELEIRGEELEIDQSILETLRPPLFEFAHTCLVNMGVVGMEAEQSGPAHIWCYAQQFGNDIALEIGFSVLIDGGPLGIIREPLRRLNGSCSLGRNKANGTSFYLRLPRVNGGIDCVLVRVGAEQFIVPAAQVQRVSDCALENLHLRYDLGKLLGIAASTGANARIQPVLMLALGNAATSVGVAVDEIIEVTEFKVKPLALYLQRPGIDRFAINARSSILLLLDLPELIRHYRLYGETRQPRRLEDASLSARSEAPKVLIADDSVFIRQSLRQILEWAQYIVLDARDGLDALEMLLESPPDILLLDIEMPVLNGYELLREMRSYPQLAHIRTIMLTSRSSERHIQQAKELGADYFLTKPVTSDMLLATIEELLASGS